MTNPFFRNVRFITRKAPAFLKQLGYTISGYEGAEAALFVGGCVWYHAKRKDQPGALFTLKVRRQGNSLKLLYDCMMNEDVLKTYKVDLT